MTDYAWGRPAEAFLAAATRKEYADITSETRFVQVGESAGPNISLPAVVRPWVGWMPLASAAFTSAMCCP